jgi:AcrR family transcriptional regulator
MSYKTKPIKQQENLKVSLLNAAKKLFLQQGYTHTSMRKIAAEVGVSATAIYLHYKDKADVMHALHQEGFKILTEKFKTLRHVAEPFERLKAMGSCYIDFALENRDYYDIMFIMKEPLEHLENPAECTEGWEEGEAAFQSLLNTVDDCQKHGYFKGYNNYQLALLLWSNLHGLCALNINGHMELVTKKQNKNIEISKLIYSCFETYIKMLEKI